MQPKNTRFHLFYSIVFGLTVTLASGYSFAHDDKRTSQQKDNLKAVDYVKGDLSVMVLGSGGPGVTADGRASAGYLVFTDGQPRVLMDVGGGTHKNFVSSGANIKDLDIILLSHLHIDHMGDLSPIVKAMYFQNRAYNLANNTFPPGRTKAIRIFGPDANGLPFPAAIFPDADPNVPLYPSTKYFVDSHYDMNTGSDRYLNIFTRAISGGIFDYQVNPKPAGQGDLVVSPDWTVYEPVTLIHEKGLKIIAVAVNHGPKGAEVPALAFRIEYKGKSIVYSGDTSSRSATFDGTALTNGGNMVEISQGADMLIYDTAIMDDAPDGPRDGVFFQLHTTPSRIGEVAAAAGVNKLVLSHITAVTESRLDEVKELIRLQGYTGKISAAADLKVYNVDRRHRD
ncbi:MAG: MBL fold metallo-hydrolase [Gammaproteobacteria bacterium]|jgi:ribonuclease BN (tRNA processing enzyme)